MARVDRRLCMYNLTYSHTFGALRGPTGSHLNWQQRPYGVTPQLSTEHGGERGISAQRRRIQCRVGAPTMQGGGWGWGACQSRRWWFTQIIHSGTPPLPLRRRGDDGGGRHRKSPSPSSLHRRPYGVTPQLSTEHGRPYGVTPQLTALRGHTSTVNRTRRRTRDQCSKATDTMSRRCAHDARRWLGLGRASVLWVFFALPLRKIELRFTVWLASGAGRLSPRFLPSKHTSLPVCLLPRIPGILVDDSDDDSGGMMDRFLLVIRSRRRSRQPVPRFHSF